MKLRIIIIILPLFLVLHVRSQEPIPESKGLDGFLYTGIGYFNYGNNLISKFMGIESEQKQINSNFEAPVKQNKFIYTFPFCFGYTLIPSRTYFFIENQPVDLTRIDATQQIGFKQRMNIQGVFQIGFIFTGIPTQVWEDPYLINSNRISTKRNEYGVKIGIDEFWGSNLLIQYTYRKIRLNKEFSGQSLDLTPDNLALLNRNGELHQVDLEYKFQLNKINRITPAFDYRRESNKGKAESYNSYGISIQYLLEKPKYQLIANVKTSNITFDSENPVFNKEQVNNTYEIYSTLLYDNPWNIKLVGDKPLKFTFTAGFYSSESSIDFYNSGGFLIMAGLYTTL